MKRPGVFLLPLECDVSASQGYPSIKFLYPFTHLVGQRHGDSKVLDQEQDVSGRARIRTTQSRVERTNHEATTSALVTALDSRLKVAKAGGFQNANSAKNETRARE